METDEKEIADMLDNVGVRPSSDKCMCGSIVVGVEVSRILV